MTPTTTPLETTDEHRTTATPRPLRPWIVAVLGVVTGLAVAVLVYEFAFRPPEPSAVDIGFAQDMSVHHAQAVDMAELIRARTEDPDVRRLAIDLELNQQAQLGQMQGWLALWDEPSTNVGPKMEWMGMPTEGHMPGMASAEELAALAAAEGVTADRLFLELMIDHHAAGVHMAAAAAEQATFEPVRRLAETMATAQRSEIATLEELLAEARGGG